MSKELWRYLSATTIDPAIVFHTRTKSVLDAHEWRELTFWLGSEASVSTSGSHP